MPEQVRQADVDDEGHDADDAELDHLAVDDVHRAARPVEDAGDAAGGGRGGRGHRSSLPTCGRYPRRVTTPRRAPGGFPVVGIIGGGQLARMCAGPGRRAGGDAERARRGRRRQRRARRAELAGRRPHRGRGRARLRPALRRRHLRPRARAGPRARPARRRGGRAAPAPGGAALRPGQARHARAAHRARRPLPAVGAGRHRGRGRPPSATPWAGRSSPRPRAAATTARACTLAADAGELTDWLERGRHPRAPVCCSRSGCRSSASSRCSSPAARPARPRRGRSSRPCRPTASAPRCSRPPPSWTPGCAAAAVHAGLRVAGELGVTGVLAVELFEVTGDDGAPAFVVNELAMRPHNCGPLVDGRRGDRPVRAAPAGGARPAARVAAAARAVDRDGQRAGRRLRRAVPGLPSRHGARPGGEGAHVRQGRAARAARSGTSTSAATTSPTCVSGPGTRRTTSREW